MFASELYSIDPTKQLGWAIGLELIDNLSLHYALKLNINKYYTIVLKCFWNQQ